ncbi:MAG: AAA family ATPase [Saprospiraceae bacterium]
MIDKIHIENYRLFDVLDIPKVGQVNLVAGKNNCGKSTLLEALRLYGCRDAQFHVVKSCLQYILFSRGDLTNDVQQSVQKFFHKRRYDRSANVNEIFYLEYLNSHPYLSVKTHNGIFDVDISHHTGLPVPPPLDDSSAFIPASFELPNARLWKSIELTDKEDKVAEILRIIEPDIVRVSVHDSDGSAKVRLKNSSVPLPLKNFGEGMNRLLAIALGLVSAENGLLLVDEIDLGLHHSVQPLLWEIVFQKARDLNVQVFATTHSSDCVRAFSAIANKPEHSGMGKYLRLQRSKKDDQIIAVDYDMEQLENAFDLSLETR